MITKTAIDLELELKLLFLIQFTLKLYFFTVLMRNTNDCIVNHL